MVRRWHRFKIHVAPTLFYLAITIVYTWPLVLHLDSAVPDPGDPLLNAWILDWGAHAVATIKPVFHAPIFHPARYAFAFSENMLGLVPLTIPLRWAGASVITVYNIAAIFGFVLSALGGYVLAWVVLRDRFAAFVGGLVFGFIPFRFDHLAHLQHLWAVWLPLSLAALISCYRNPSRKNFALLWLAFVFNGLTNIHWFLFGALALALSTALLSLLQSASNRRRLLAGTLLAFGLGTAVLLPILLPYQKASRLYGMKRYRGETLQGSAHLGDWLVSTPRSLIYGKLHSTREGEHERRLFPGLAVLLISGICLVAYRRRHTSDDLLTAAGDRTRRRSILVALDALTILAAVATYLAIADGRLDLRNGASGLTEARSYAVPLVLTMLLLVTRASLRLHGSDTKTLRTFLLSSRFSPEMLTAFLWIAVGIVGSLGLNAFFHEFLYHEFAAFRSVRTPARWAMVAYVGMSLTTAAGTTVLQRLSERRWLAPLLILPLLVLDMHPGRIRWYFETEAEAPVYEWLRSQNDSVTLELPLTTNGGKEVRYLLGHAQHHQRIINGVSGFEPTIHHEIANYMAQDPIDDRLMPLLERIGCTHLIVHTDVLLDGAEHIVRWLSEHRDEFQLIRRFDHGVYGDYVLRFGISPRAEPPTMADRIAFDDLLRGKYESPNEGPFGKLESPKAYSEVRGPLLVSGLALGNTPIVKVLVHLENRRVTIPAELMGRDDVLQRYPQYLSSHRPGFALRLEKRPKNARRETDVQVEVLYASGDRLLLPHAWIDWTPRRRMQFQEWSNEGLAAVAGRLSLTDEERARVAANPSELFGIAYDRVSCECSDDDFIRLIYEMLLGRPVDDVGLRSKRRHLRNGGDRLDLMDEVLASKEFARAHGK